MVQISNYTNNVPHATGTAVSTFEIDIDDKPPSLTIARPVEGERRPTTTVEDLEIEVEYADSKSGVDLASLVVTLDGEDITSQLAVDSAEASRTWPRPMAEGTHVLAASIRDMKGHQAHAQTMFSVELVPPVVTEESAFISGRVLHGISGEPLPGAEVWLSGRVGTAITDSTGIYRYAVPETGRYTLTINKVGFIYAQRSVQISSRESKAVEVVTLWPMDPKITHVDKDIGGEVTDSKGLSKLTIPPGALDHDLDMQITIISKDEMRDVWPVAQPLPKEWQGFIEFYFFPPDVYFKAPATMDVVNTTLYQLPPGAPVGFGFYDEEVGRWMPVGPGVVQDDGRTIRYTIGRLTCCSSYVKVAPPPPPPEPPTPPPPPPPPPPPKDKCGANAGSTVQYKDGNLIESHEIPLGRVQSKSDSLTLTYQSNHVDPKVLLNVVLPTSIPAGSNVSARFAAADVTASTPVSLPSYENSVRWLWDGRDASGSRAPTGPHPYRVETEITYPPDTFPTRCVEQGAAQLVIEFPRIHDFPTGPVLYRCIGGRLFLVDLTTREIREEVPLPIWRYPTSASAANSGTVEVVNRRHSSAGAGWEIAELDRLSFDRNGDARIIESGGAVRIFEPDLGTVLSPPLPAKEVVHLAEPISLDSIFGLLGASAAGPLDSDLGGNLYVVLGGNRIVRIDPWKNVTLVAGGGTKPLSDGAHALDVAFEHPYGQGVPVIADVAANERNVYILVVLPKGVGAFPGQPPFWHRIYRLDRNGYLHHVAGDPLRGGEFCPDPIASGPAKQICFKQPVQIEVGEKSDVLYVLDADAHAVRMIVPEGLGATLAGTGVAGASEDGIPASSASLDEPSAIKIGPDGDLYVAERSRIRRVNISTGTIRTVAGGGDVQPRAAWMPALTASLHTAVAHSMAFDAAGSLYFVQEDFSGLQQINADGLLRVVANNFVPPNTCPRPTYPGGFLALGVEAMGMTLFWFDPVACGSVMSAVPRPEVVVANFKSPKGDFSRLGRLLGGGFVRRHPNGDEDTFSPTGQLLRRTDANGNLRSYAYDGQQRLIAVTDVMGRATQLFYAPDGHLERIVDPTGRATRLEHDAAGNLTQVVQPDGTIRGFNYDSEHHLISQINPRGFATQYVYNNLGMVIQVNRPDTSTFHLTPADSIGLINPFLGPDGAATLKLMPARQTDVIATAVDGRGGISRFVCDPAGRALDTTDPLGRKTSVVLNDQFLVTRIVRPNGAATNFAYDALGNLLSTTRQTDNATTLMTYDPDHNEVTSITDALGRVTQFAYDTAGNLTQTTDAAGAASQFAYNLNGLLVSTTSPLAHSTTFSYDPLGNLASVADPLNNVTSFLNDSAGNVTQVTDALGRATRYTYDVMNRLTSVTNALSGITRYTYDPNSNLTSVHDPRGHMTTFLYDSMNRLASSTDPLGRTETYQYDFNGNLIRKTKRDGSAIDLLYDAANQLLEKREPLNVTRYSYDLNGNLTSVTDSDSDVSFVYDPLDRVLRTQSSVLGAQSSPVIDYTYDPVGNRLSMTQLAPDPSPLTTTYSYDPVNRLVSLSNPESQIWNFSYDAAGRRIGLMYPNGVVTSYSYNAASQLLSLHHDQSGSPVAHFDYAYDPVGNRIQKGELDGSTGYFYDPLNRLISASTTIPGLPQEFYSYDAVGNRIASYLSSSHVHDSANQLLEDQQFFYSYDPNGNQTGKTAKDGAERWVYTYDAENQLIGAQRFAPATATAPLMTAGYAYDGLGRRIAKAVDGVTTTFVYDGAYILAEQYAPGGFRFNVHTHRIDEVLSSSESSGVLYYHAGSLDSVGAVTDSGGNLLGQNIYESFGQPASGGLTTDIRYGFIGREFDAETGLYHVRQRQFDPSQGRFISRDRFSSLAVFQMANLPRTYRARALRERLLRLATVHGSYDYALNNPILLQDNNGEFAWYVAAGATMVAGAAASVYMTGKAYSECMNQQTAQPGTPANQAICDATGVTPEEAADISKQQAAAQCASIHGKWAEPAGYMYDSIGSAVTTIGGWLGTQWAGVAP